MDVDVRRVSRSAWLLWLLGVAPLLLACVNVDRAPRGGNLSQERRVAPLALTQYSVNLREEADDDVVQAHFDFWNHSGERIEITQLDPSCGCLGPVLEGRKKSYLPGEEGRIFVSVATATATPGEHLETLNIKYTAGEEQHERVVTFRYRIPERKVTVAPSQLLFYQLQGEDGQQELKVVDARRKNMRVVSAESKNELVDVEIGERTIDANGVPTTPLRVVLRGPIPPGRHTTHVVIHTDDPDFPKLQVPVLIQGPAEIQQASGIASPPFGGSRINK